MPELTTLNSAILSSDEEDEDYAPPEQNSDSDGETRRDNKKQRVKEPTPAPANPVTSDATRNALWESFLESTTTSTPGSSRTTPLSELKTITVEKRHRFAGEDVIEKVQVAEDSAEAAEWKRSQLPTTASEKTSAAAGPSPSIAPAPSAPNLINPTSRSSSAGSIKSTSTPTTTKPKPKPAAKPRKSLSGMAAATKPKKLTTLEKSKLDWQSHLATVTPGERDELERNRQSGGTGYLEKVDFLARVGERRENAFEDSKRKRR